MKSHGHVSQTVIYNESYKLRGCDIMGFNGEYEYLKDRDMDSV